MSSVYLQISIDNALAVQIGKCFNHTGTVESNFGLFERATIAQQRPQFAAQTAFQEHVEILAIFECFVQSRRQKPRWIDTACAWSVYLTMNSDRVSIMMLRSFITCSCCFMATMCCFFICFSPYLRALRVSCTSSTRPKPPTPSVHTISMSAKRRFCKSRSTSPLINEALERTRARSTVMTSDEGVLLVGVAKGFLSFQSGEFVGDHLAVALPIENETRDTVGVVDDDVERSSFLPRTNASP